MSDRAKGFRLETGHRLFLLFINLMIIVLIYAAEFITWTGCGEQSIYGIQGRYFLPCLPILLLAVKPERLKIRSSEKTVFIVCAAAFGVCCCTIADYLKMII